MKTKFEMTTEVDYRGEFPIDATLWGSAQVTVCMYGEDSDGNRGKKHIWIHDIEVEGISFMLDNTRYMRGFDRVKNQKEILAEIATHVYDIYNLSSDHTSR